MDSSFEGFVLDPAKCSKLSMEDRREIVYELAKRSHGAAEMLQSWSRQDILEILCAEMGKERKYTGLTKLKIIEHLLKIVSEKNILGHEDRVPEQTHRPSKRQRKPDHPSHVPSSCNQSISNSSRDLATATYCKNSACKASLSQEDVFCKRCSCCICHKFDDNKDPSLWLTCNAEPPFMGDACNFSCHLDCAFRHERSGISRNGLDGSFYCVSCGKMNDLMRCWRKQLTIAKDTRRVDILSYRLSLSQKLLEGTRKYEKLYYIVDEAVNKLEAEVGPLTGSPVKMGRGIVNRLSTGQEVQRLCASAVEVLDLMNAKTTLEQDSKLVSPSMIRFVDITANSVTVILCPERPSLENNLSYTMWHRMAHGDTEVPGPTCTLYPQQTRYFVSGLTPATEYIFKVVAFDNTKELSSWEVRVTTSVALDDIAKDSMIERSQSPVTNCSSLSNPSSVEDETNNVVPCSHLKDNKADNYFACYNHTEGMAHKNLSNDPLNSSRVCQNRNPSPASDEDQTMGRVGSTDQSNSVLLKDKNISETQLGEELSGVDGSNSLEKPKLQLLPCSRPETGSPATPCRVELFKDSAGKNRRTKSSNGTLSGGSGKGDETHIRTLSNKRPGFSHDEEDLEYYIKVIRRLECNGHIDKSFRQKFLTWYSMRATPQEAKIVKVFVDTLIEDPASLSEQLIDTFGNLVSTRSSSVPSGFCLKLWH